MRPGQTHVKVFYTFQNSSPGIHYEAHCVLDLHRITLEIVFEDDEMVQLNSDQVQLPLVRKNEFKWFSNAFYSRLQMQMHSC